MKIYKSTDFDLHKIKSARGDLSVGLKKENNESFYIKAMIPNQLINLIIANSLFRKCLGEDLIPEVAILIDYSSTIAKYYSVMNKIKLHPAYYLPHLYNGVHCSEATGWGFDCQVIKANIGVDNPNCINAEKGGLATILFQDSDCHIGNEAYIKQDNKYSYIRLDVDHADMVFIPSLSKIIELQNTLQRYNFSCKALTVLEELISEREIFKQSILQSLGDIYNIFSDDDSHRTYQGLEGFKAEYDTSNYYKPINFTRKDELGTVVLTHFDLIFDHAESQLNKINANHSFTLGGVICNPQEEL